jgi:hypothetical protein
VIIEHKVMLLRNFFKTVTKNFLLANSFNITLSYLDLCLDISCCVIGLNCLLQFTVQPVCKYVDTVCICVYLVSVSVSMSMSGSLF